MQKIKACFSCSLFMILFLTACSSSKANKDFLYFQNNRDSSAELQLKEPLIQPNDLLDIQVFSKTLNQDQASLFNIPNGSGTHTNGCQVNTEGTIDVPLIGSLKAAGLTREQLGSNLADKLTPYVKDPSVIVRFLQYKINVLGEVKSPGTKNFQTDAVTIIDAISAAGDLTDYGKRQNVLVIREEAGKRISYTIDLRDKSLFQSPVYQLKQNDIVYVGANNNKLKTLNANPTGQRNFQVGVTIFSLLATLVSVITVITK